jgi:hypothetical protein
MPAKGFFQYSPADCLQDMGIGAIRQKNSPIRTGKQRHSKEAA